MLSRLTTASIVKRWGSKSGDGFRSRPAAISLLNLSELWFLQSRIGIRVSISQGSSDASEIKSSPNTSGDSDVTS